MPELEILEAKVPVRTPVLVKEAETASARLGPVAGWLSVAHLRTGLASQ